MRLIYMYVCASVLEKLKERCLRWFRHVIRANENLVAKVGFNIEVDRKRPKDRPEQWWLDTLGAGLKASRLDPDQAFDRARLRNRSRRAAPDSEPDKDLCRVYQIYTIFGQLQIIMESPSNFSL